MRDLIRHATYFLLFLGSAMAMRAAVRSARTREYLPCRDAHRRSSTSASWASYILSRKEGREGRERGRERGEGRGGRVEERQKRDTVKMFSSCSTLIPTDPRPINFDTLSAPT